VRKARWEDRLEALNEPNKAILLRYGGESEPHSPNPFIETLSIPSKILQRHNLEILIATLDTSVAQRNKAPSSEDIILTPTLRTPVPRSHPSTISLPVHKSLVIGNGIGSAVEFGRLTADNSLLDSALVKFAVGVAAPNADEDVEGGHQYTPLNIELASEALEKFRQSSENSEVYEKGWFNSGVPELSDWLVHDLDHSEGKLPKTLNHLISSTVDGVEIVVIDEANRQLTDALNLEKTRNSLAKQLQTWAEKSHEELRDQLDDAFAVGNWRRLSWWKLFWRVDDVAMVTSEILKQRWLVDAEKTSIYLAGCLSQSTAMGTSEATRDDDLKTSTEGIQETDEFASARDGVEQKAVSFTQNRITTIADERLWPLHISSTRDRLLTETVPPLHALAQRLVVSTLSTTALSSTLSALIYISASGLGIFEAGAVAAVGLVFSLRLMQTLWETARSGWEGEVREEGRKALRYTEVTIKENIESFGISADSRTVRQKTKIKELIAKVRGLLDT
jgi:hypothetical protein